MVKRRFAHSRLLTGIRVVLSIVLFVEVAAAQVGPGIGNIDCAGNEVFEPLAFIDHDNGGDPHGQNVTVMIRGYFLTVYAPDSGLPPGRIGVYDVSNPRSPTEARYYSGPETNNFREQHSLPIGLIDGKQYIAMQTRDGIQFWDFTDPLNAYVAGSIDLPGVTGGDYENVAWQAAWQGQYLYVAGGNQGIYVIDAADPMNPDLRNQVSTGSTGGFRVGPIFAMGDVMVISNMDQGGSYAVLNISDPENPSLLDSLNFAPRMYAIAVGANHRFYTAGRDGNFLIHSFSDPSNITEIKNANIGQDQLYTAVQDQFVFVGRQNNVIKVDVTNEQNPEVVGEGDLNRGNPDHGQVTPMGNLIYVGNDHGTGSAFFCHQMGQDTTPLAVQTVYPDSGATSISADGRVTILFSDFVNMETVSTETVTVRPIGGEALSGIYTYQFNQLSFSPDEPFAEDTTYEVVVPADGLKDVMGNGLVEDALFIFSTGSSVMLPVPDPPPPPSGTGGATTSGGGGAGGGGAGGGGASGGGTSGGGASGGATGGAPSFPVFVAPPAGGAPSFGSGGVSGGASGGSGGLPGLGSGGFGPMASSGGDAGVPVPPSAAGSCTMNPNADAAARTFAFAITAALAVLAGRRRRRI